jgi:UDP-4-amino-4,6-dideoxy-N-acetyl-beta-L-altrosamine transaminase
MSERFIPYGLHQIDEDDIDAVVEVLKSDWITTGPKIKEFEDAVCKYIGCKHGVAVNSGTSALDIAVASLELPKGSEIITTPFTFVATSNAIVYNNLTPIFVDIKPDTFNINPDEIRKKITDKTNAIINVDFAGHPCELDEIRKIADENGLYLIEDACHALGAEYKDKKVGNFADITVFSFHPVKHITTGEGGMAVTNVERLAIKMRMLRNLGIDIDPESRKDYRYDMKLLGRNYRMTDFQAALGISQLKKLDSFIAQRKFIADTYTKEFEEVNRLIVPIEKSGIKHAWHLFTPLVKKGLSRDMFFISMRSKNIGVNVHYIPVYRHSYYKRYMINPRDYPVTEDIFSRIISLPLYPTLNKEEVAYVIKSVRTIIKEL